MTLGEPQPLSRRQARELAREQAAAAHSSLPTVDVPVLTPAALAPNSFAASAPTRRSNRHQYAVVEPADTGAADARAFVPDDAAAPDDADTADPATPDPAAVDPAAVDPAAVDPAAVDPAAVETAHPAATDPSGAGAGSGATVGTVPVGAPVGLTRRELRAQSARKVTERATAGERSTEITGSASRVPTALPTTVTDSLQAAPIAEETNVEEPGIASPTLTESAVSPNQDVRSREPSGWTAPIGHWSVSADAPHANATQPDQSLDELINRGIGAGGIPTTTNALILPSIPQQPNSVSPISNTGEIMITGSFDLPRSLGSTGAHPNLFDSSEMDHIMDQLDADQIGGDSAPVSASRAVSTHASTRGVLTPPKKSRASLPVILVVTTAVLAVSVLALFITGYLSGSY